MTLVQLEVNEDPEGNNEWTQLSFTLIQRQFLHFSETEGCHLEKLLKDKDIPPGNGETDVFETSPQFPVCRRRPKVSLSGWCLSVRALHSSSMLSGEQDSHRSRWPRCLFVVIEAFWEAVGRKACIAPEGMVFI